MNQFSADIAAILEIAVIAAGLITLYFAKKESSKLLSGAAWLMIVGGILSIICTTMFWFKYYKQGDFASAQLSVKVLPSEDMMHHYYPEGADISGKENSMYHFYPKD